MKVHLNQIPLDGLHLEGVEDHDILELDDPLIRPVSQVRYSLDLGLSEDGLFATGMLEVDLEMQCVRCLRDFRQALRLDGFALQTELDGKEMIDLTPLVREDIVLTLPAHPHCDWDGRNPCPGLTAVTSGGKTARNLPPTESAASAPSAWEALDQLQLKTKE